MNENYIVKYKHFSDPRRELISARSLLYSPCNNIKSPVIKHFKSQLTELIPGKLSTFPITGTLLRKLTTTGRNPLQGKKTIWKTTHFNKTKTEEVHVMRSEK